MATVTRTRSGRGTWAAIAGLAGKLREAEQLAGASVAVMRRIDQQWGAARALLGLGDLARLRGHPGEAHSRYVEALPILQDIGARPEIARCLAGGRGAARAPRQDCWASRRPSRVWSASVRLRASGI